MLSDFQCQYLRRTEAQADFKLWCFDYWAETESVVQPRTFVHVRRDGALVAARVGRTRVLKTVVASDAPHTPSTTAQRPR